MLMENNLVAHASVDIAAGKDKVWDALVNPLMIKKYMFGTNVVTDWREGSPIVWKGEWQGRSYEDKGEIRRFSPQHSLQYTHFSPMSGLPDSPENYHTVTIELVPEGDRTRVSLSQDNNPTESARQHSEKNWRLMLDSLKQLLEN
jgi:uncharacterized protein YndB with AHSA1/START domain